MKFRNESVSLLRKKLIKSNFYKDITFESKQISESAKKAIEHWIFRLEKNEKIRIEKFRDLFDGLHEIVFPIKIKAVRSSKYDGFDIEVIDTEGKEYYMSRRNYYNNIETNYIIGRRNSSLEPLIDRDFHYIICQDKTILLVETGAMKLKADGTNDDSIVDFCYNYKKNTTEATLKSFSSTNKIIIKYPTIGYVFDKKVLEFLFHVNESNWYYYDVFPILKWMLLVLSDEKVKLSITAEVEKEICSEVDIVDGIVQKYTKTEIISEAEIKISKRIIAKKLEEFLAENS